MVHTAETTRVKFFMDILMEKGHPVMLVGSAGSGKTVLVGDKLSLLPESYAIANVPFNFYTTSGSSIAHCMSLVQKHIVTSI
jgi:dynein heavy chain